MWLRLEVKANPEQAAIMMKMMGTSEGQRLYPKIDWMQASATGQRKFKLKELLNSYTLRQYCGKTILTVQEQLRKRMIRESRGPHQIETSIEDENE